MANLKDLIDYPHHIYKTYFETWRFYLDSYEGGAEYTRASVNTGQTSGGSLLDKFMIKVFAGGKEVKDMVQSNLFKHAKETDKDYQTRLSMSQYYNFCAPVIDIYTSHLFKDTVIENFENIESDVESRRENINRMGDSVSEFRRNLGEMTQVYGHSFIIVDHPRALGDIKNRLDKIQLDNFPYFTLIHPQNLVNWALDRFGRPYWIVVREIDDTNQNPYEYSSDKNTDINYRLWTRQEWVLMSAEGKEIMRGNHGLGVVPIVCAFDRKSKKQRNFLGISTLADISFISRDIYNSLSELRQILRDQTFAFLAIQGSSDEYNEISIGTNKALLYPADRNAPAYISPPTDNAMVYMDHIDRQVKRIYQLAKLEGGQAHDVRVGKDQSGVSKAFDFFDTNTSLSAKAENLQDAETKAWQMFAKWVDKPDFEGSISYPKDFNINSLNDEIDRALKTAQLQIGNEYRKQVNIAIIKKQFPRMSEEELNKMIAEVENSTGEEETPASALLRRAGIKINRTGNLPGIKKG